MRSGRCKESVQGKSGRPFLGRLTRAQQRCTVFKFVPLVAIYTLHIVSRL